MALASCIPDDHSRHRYALIPAVGRVAIGVVPFIKGFHSSITSSLRKFESLTGGDPSAEVMFLEETSTNEEKALMFAWSPGTLYD